MKQLPLPFKYSNELKAETIAKLFHYQFGYWRLGWQGQGLEWATRDVERGGWILYLKKDLSAFAFKNVSKINPYRIVLTDEIPGAERLDWRTPYSENRQEDFSLEEILKYVDEVI